MTGRGPTPHLQDHRPREFSVGGVAADGDSAWVVDSYHPLLVRLDAPSGLVEGPFVLGDPSWARKGGAKGPWSVVAGRGAVWCRQGAELIRIEHGSGDRARFQVPGELFAVGDEGAWAVEIGRRTVEGSNRPDHLVLRHADEAEGTVREALHDEPILATSIAVGQGSVWVAGLLPPDSSGRLYRFGLDGVLQAATVFGGRVSSLWIDEGGVWVVTDELIPDGSGLDTRVLGIDSVEMSIVSEVRDAGVFGGALTAGEIWTRSRPTRDTGEAGAINRIDPRTGELLGGIPVPSMPRSIVGGEDGVWLDVVSSVVKLGIEGPVTEFRFPGDLRVPEELLPPPLPAIEAEAWEREKLEEVSESMLGTTITHELGAASRLGELHFFEAGLLGSFPETQLAVYFHAEAHPGLVLGSRVPLWNPDGSADVHFTDWLVDIVGTREELLMNPAIGDDGVAWL